MTDTSEVVEVASVTACTVDKKKKSSSLISLVMATIVVVQVVFLVFLIYGFETAPAPRPMPYVAYSEEAEPAPVKHLVLISVKDGRLFEFEDVTVRKTPYEGYWIYSDNDESVHIPFRCIYLENPTDTTIQKFVKGEDDVQSTEPSGNSGDRGQVGQN